MVAGVVSPRRPEGPPPLPEDLAGLSGAGNHPAFVYNGGPVVNTPRVFLLFVGDWSSAPNQTRATRLGQFMTDLLNSRYMNILSQYGCGLTGTVVSSVFVATPDNDLSTTDVHGILQTAINNNDVPEPTDPANVYILFLDDAIAVNDAVTGAVMCEATSDTAFGYHHFFSTTAGNTCVFAVVPALTDACLQNSCPGDDGNCSLHLAQTQEQRQTQVTSHEFAEMISNPQVGGDEAWSEPIGPHENGDICNGQSGTITVGANTWTVQLMYSKWHDMQTAGATTCIVDTPNPLPSLLPACSVILDRSTFGKDEVDALVHEAGGPATVEAAFYVVVDGFTPAQLSITAADLVGPPSHHPTVQLSPGVVGMSVANPSRLIAEDPTLGAGIQRFTWVYGVTFTNSNGFPANAGDVTPVTLSASVTSVAAPINTASGSALVQLIHEPNPYEVDGSVSWLSTDLRVFQLNAGQSKFGATLGNTPGAALSFITDVIGRLNSGNTAGQTFENDISTDENTSRLELSETVNGTAVFNFAIAKVRYRSLTSDVSDVRVWFRMFPASTTSTDYQQGTTYRRGGPGGDTLPKLGIVSGELVTIPFFATARVDPTTHTMDDQLDPPNVRTIGHDAAGHESVEYFGCWLDINQTQLLFPINPSPADGPWTSNLKAIQELIRNAHQCLVAEIAFSPDPIPAGASPGSSDKLAQRNLSIVPTDNPGAASHTIPNTFEVRGTPAVPEGMLPDELLIDWSTIPPGSEATIFIPGANAAQILETADEIYVSHRLAAVDGQTLKVPAEGLTYIPVPPHTGADLPGLLTVSLPSSLRRGQAFKIVVRQVTNAAGRAAPPPVEVGSGQAEGHAKRQLIRWRRVLGSYQISIPVHTTAVLLAPEERLLSVLRWIERAIPPSNRWFPVFTRYVEQVADRVRGLGGNPDIVLPSPRGEWKRPPERLERCVTGTVCDVVFDCFGNFEGFTLDMCTRTHFVTSREPRIAKLMLKACREHLRVEVCLDEHRRERIEKIIVRC